MPADKPTAEPSREALALVRAALSTPPGIKCSDAGVASKLDLDGLLRLRDENRVLRGLVQTNPDWKCPHGTGVKNMGLCPLGFPGCACADDRIAVFCEDEERIVSRLREENERLRAAIQKAKALHRMVYDGPDDEEICLMCAEWWPCDTYTALRGGDADG